MENSIRDLITITLETSAGENRWNEKVPPIVRDEVRKRIEKDVDSGVTLQSEEHIEITIEEPYTVDYEQ